MSDLNAVMPWLDSARDATRLEAIWGARVRSAEVTGADLLVHFGDLKARAIDFINDSQMVVGCVAWLTELDILRALTEIPALLAVQKEDFLRPDSKGFSARRMRALYEKISCPYDRYSFPFPLGEMSWLTDPGWSGADRLGRSTSSVRCVGNHNRDKAPAMARMHHKFIVRVRVDEPVNPAESAHPTFVPTAVWTGSFNFSANATKSFENAVEIHSADAAQAYFDEFLRVMSLSEPLDWTSDWCEPEWRIGT